ncbi:hypothetical protein Pyn_03462 [Prunus yedoensis var. nudiflora]|uniref:Uncharacterized protein n=1 Tax=Prunus yedoensis var. nudiflora TaxID=2094558 RepID=A0A314YCM3_PRUYE|nr:hypothetical protein Pyn_03462 [Prunus yedoensis var. nudiflora]
MQWRIHHHGDETGIDYSNDGPSQMLEVVRIVDDDDSQEYLVGKINLNGPTDSGIEVDISGMSWGEVIESELQGAFVYEHLDPGHDAGASCSRPNRKRKQPTYLKDYYTF